MSKSTYKIKVPQPLSNTQVVEFAEKAAQWSHERTTKEFEKASAMKEFNNDIKFLQKEIDKALKAVETKEIEVEYTAYKKVNLEFNEVNYYDVLTNGWLKTEPLTNDESYDDSEVIRAGLYDNIEEAEVVEETFAEEV